MKRLALLSFVFLVMPICGSAVAQTVTITSLANTQPAGGIVANVTVNPGGMQIDKLTLVCVGGDGSFYTDSVNVNMGGNRDIATSITSGTVGGQVNYQCYVTAFYKQGNILHTLNNGTFSNVWNFGVSRVAIAALCLVDSSFRHWSMRA